MKIILAWFYTDRLQATLEDAFSLEEGMELDPREVHCFGPFANCDDAMAYARHMDASPRDVSSAYKERPVTYVCLRLQEPGDYDDVRDRHWMYGTGMGKGLWPGWFPVDKHVSDRP
jgi:hypothetical protein